MSTAPQTVEPLRPGQNMVRAGHLAALLEISTVTLWRWTVSKPEFREAQYVRGIYKVQPLLDAGVLARPQDETAAAKGPEVVVHV